ncbi:MAG: FHA domain-containing protein, partial [Propionibacteriaceae bacterium]|nr:FHA domain-containing protein [Propionibacteriaceae bacterium]
MQLWLVVTTPTDLDGTECVVDVAPHHTIADLSRALARQAGLDADGLRCHLPRSGGVIPPELSVEASDLRFGDTVLLAPAGWQASSLPEGVTGELVVVGGPAAGRRHPLPAAPQTVGRSSPAEIAIDDPMLSRKHFSVAIDGPQVVVTDLGSTNGTYLDGVQVRGSRTVAAGTVIEAGHSLFRVDLARAAASPSLRLRHGIVGFNRPPRVTATWEPPVHHVPKPPRKPERRRLGVASWLAPLLLGAVMLALGASEQSTTMMAIGGLGLLMSPVMMVAGHIEETRGGSRRYRTELVAYRAELAELATALDAGLEEEVVRRRLEGPSAADLAARAQELSADLWERRPDDGDFLQVSVGWADQPTLMTVVLPAEGDAGLLAEAETLAEQHETAVNVPILLNLREIGGAGL